MGNEISGKAADKTNKEDTGVEGEETTTTGIFDDDSNIATEEIEIILNKDYSKLIPFTNDMHIPWRTNIDQAEKCRRIEIWNDVKTTKDGRGVWIVRLYNDMFDKIGIRLINTAFKAPKEYTPQFTKFHDCVFKVSIHEEKALMEEEKETIQKETTISKQDQLEGDGATNNAEDEDNDKRGTQYLYYRFLLLDPPDGEFTVRLNIYHMIMKILIKNLFMLIIA